jgi:hypothetical protein
MVMKMKVPSNFVERHFIDMFRALNVRGVSGREGRGRWGGGAVCVVVVVIGACVAGISGSNVLAFVLSIPCILVLPVCHAVVALDGLVSCRAPPQ